MRYFFDTEFIEDGLTIDLISIGVVAEDGREFYRENSQVPWYRSNDFVNEHVRPHLKNEGIPEEQIKDDLLAFIGDDKPEFWAYYASYDWVVLCQMFGAMIDLPKGWNKFVMDIVWRLKLADGMGLVLDLPKQEGTEHHALADAQWNRDCCFYLDALGVPS